MLHEQEGTIFRFKFDIVLEVSTQSHKAWEELHDIETSLLLLNPMFPNHIYIIYPFSPIYMYHLWNYSVECTLGNVTILSLINGHRNISVDIWLIALLSIMNGVAPLRGDNFIYSIHITETLLSVMCAAFFIGDPRERVQLVLMVLITTFLLHEDRVRSPFRLFPGNYPCSSVPLRFPVSLFFPPIIFPGSFLSRCWS